MEKLEELLAKEYPVKIYRIPEGPDSSYYFAFLPDFGHSACSAVGDTREEAIKALEFVKRDVIQYFLETGKQIPEPSKASFEESPH